MKKIAYLGIITALTATFTSCDGNKLKQAQSENAELKSDLQETLATQDSLFALLNDITDGMNQIKDLEKIVTMPSHITSESQSRKDQIRQDMAAIQQALQERRERLEQLEARLKALNGQSATTAKTIQNLKNQIADQQTEIAMLTNKLSEANVEIERLGTTVSKQSQTIDSLGSHLDHEKSERRLAQLEAENTRNELNLCYYAVGSKGELKSNNIVETAFLRSDKVLKADFDKSYFTEGDVRTLKTIPLYSKKAKVLTDQPSDSYEITVDNEGLKSLYITNPERFWQTSRYLVVQID